MISTSLVSRRPNMDAIMKYGITTAIGGRNFWLSTQNALSSRVFQLYLAKPYAAKLPIASEISVDITAMIKLFLKKSKILLSSMIDW